MTVRESRLTHLRDTRSSIEQRLSRGVECPDYKTALSAHLSQVERQITDLEG